MQKLSKSIIAGATMLVMATGVAAADHSSIEAVLNAYESALNASDTERVIPLYTSDGIFMAQHNLPNIGSDQIRAAYNGAFQAIDLDIEFTIDEIVQLSSNWAFARTRSEGIVTINATGDTAPEANQELFVFKKQDDGEWKIARYIFSTTNPPR